MGGVKLERAQRVDEMRGSAVDDEELEDDVANLWVGGHDVITCVHRASCLDELGHDEAEGICDPRGQDGDVDAAAVGSRAILEMRQELEDLPWDRKRLVVDDELDVASVLPHI